jgi:hypothetical protein
MRRNLRLMKRLSFIDVANASLNDGRLMTRAQPGQKAKRRNLPLVKATLLRRSQTPRAVLIDPYPDDEQHLKSIPTARRG